MSLTSGRLVALTVLVMFTLGCTGPPDGLTWDDSPEALADGSEVQAPPAQIMDAIAPFVDGEVIAAKLVSLAETDLPACSAGITWERPPQPSPVVALPESYWWYFEGAGRADIMGTRSRLDEGASGVDSPPSTGPVRELARSARQDALGHVKVPADGQLIFPARRGRLTGALPRVRWSGCRQTPLTNTRRSAIHEISGGTHAHR